MAILSIESHGKRTESDYTGCKKEKLTENFKTKRKQDKHDGGKVTKTTNSNSYHTEERTTRNTFRIGSLPLRRLRASLTDIGRTTFSQFRLIVISTPSPFKRMIVSTNPKTGVETSRQGMSTVEHLLSRPFCSSFRELWSSCWTRASEECTDSVTSKRVRFFFWLRKTSPTPNCKIQSQHTMLRICTYIGVRHSDVAFCATTSAAHSFNNATSAWSASIAALRSVKFTVSSPKTVSNVFNVTNCSSTPFRVYFVTSPLL